MPTGDPAPATVVRNIIKKYGMSQAASLISALQNFDSGEEIARDFGVSRERVRQWKNSLGMTVHVYQVHPEVCAVLEGGVRKKPK